jgi:hypothetical protein
MVSLAAGNMLAKTISAQGTPLFNSFWLRLGRAMKEVNKKPEKTARSRVPRNTSDSFDLPAHPASRGRCNVQSQVAFGVITPDFLLRLHGVSGFDGC